MAGVVEAHVIVSGRVQGVWFRGNTQRFAAAAGVRGWVRNLPDRRVEAVLQ
jgi:acylphosphatase